jgi:hypothetical protein
MGLIMSSMIPRGRRRWGTGGQLRTLASWSATFMVYKGALLEV